MPGHGSLLSLPPPSPRPLNIDPLSAQDTNRAWVSHVLVFSSELACRNTKAYLSTVRVWISAWCGCVACTCTRACGRLPVEEGIVGALGGEGERSERVHDEVDPEHLDGAKRRLARDRANELQDDGDLGGGKGARLVKPRRNHATRQSEVEQWVATRTQKHYAAAQSMPCEQTNHLQLFGGKKT